jgi:hypothetical protein
MSTPNLVNLDQRRLPTAPKPRPRTRRDVGGLSQRKGAAPTEAAQGDKGDGFPDRSPRAYSISSATLSCVGAATWLVREPTERN